MTNRICLPDWSNRMVGMADWPGGFWAETKGGPAKITDWRRGSRRAGRAGRMVRCESRRGCCAGLPENLANCRTSAAGWGMIGMRLQMCNENEWIVREAFLAYDRGDIERTMDFVDPDLEWTYVDAGAADPQPEVRHG